MNRILLPAVVLQSHASSSFTGVDWVDADGRFEVLDWNLQDTPCVVPHEKHSLSMAPFHSPLFCLAFGLSRLSVNGMRSPFAPTTTPLSNIFAMSCLRTRTPWRKPWDGCTVRLVSSLICFFSAVGRSSAVSGPALSILVAVRNTIASRVILFTKWC